RSSTSPGDNEGYPDRGQRMPPTAAERRSPGIPAHRQSMDTVEDHVLSVADLVAGYREAQPGQAAQQRAEAGLHDGPGQLSAKAEVYAVPEAEVGACRPAHD